MDSLCSRPDSLLASRAISTACFAPKAVTVVSLLACSFDELSSVHHNLLCRLTGSMLIALYESERDVLNLFCHALHACMFENRTIVESARYSLSKLFTYLISALQDNIVLHSFNSWLKTALHGVGDYNDSVASVMLRGFRILVSYTPLALKHSDKVSSDKQDSMDLVCLLAKSSMPLSTLSILHSQNQVDQFIVASINEMSITKLRQYQWEGVSWITMLRRNGLSGILADEM
ncbi:hypothetical protein EON65_00810 [archaeon]|nr:MAG: hypothetical protein EON65_00810 [archaeon]